MLDRISKLNVRRSLSRWNWAVGVCILSTIWLSGLAHAQNSCQYAPSSAQFPAAGGGYQNFCAYPNVGGISCVPDSIVSSAVLLFKR